MKIRVRGLDRKSKWRCGEFNGYMERDGKLLPTVYVPGETVYTIPDEKTIGLCSGKNDKNGKEIYSGDVLENKNGIRFEVRYGDYAMYCPDMPLGPTHEYARIIGNVFQNPGLRVKDSGCNAETGKGGEVWA